MHNFKPGDLALVIDGLEAKHIGMVVELLEYAGKCTAYFDGEGWVGYLDDNGKPAWKVCILCCDEVSYGFEHNLMPLRGDPDQLPAKKEERPVCAM